MSFTNNVKNYSIEQMISEKKITDFNEISQLKLRKIYQKAFCIFKNMFD